MLIIERLARLTCPPFDKREGIFFIGTFLQSQNIDPVEILYSKKKLYKKNVLFQYGLGGKIGKAMKYAIPVINAEMRAEGVFWEMG